jgi:hypothetical protein
MSATEIPELDTRNLVFRTIYEMVPPAIYDPIGKLVMRLGRVWREQFEFGISIVDMLYIPKFNLALFDEPMSQEQWDELRRLGADESVGIASASVGYERRGGIFLGIVKTETFKGIGLRGQEMLQLNHRSESQEEYKFWPEGLAGRDQAIAKYFLEYLGFLLTTYEPSQSLERSSLGRPTECGVAIRQDLLDYIGADAFSCCELLEDGLTIVLRKDVWVQKGVKNAS